MRRKQLEYEAKAGLEASDNLWQTADVCSPG